MADLDAYLDKLRQALVANEGSIEPEHVMGLMEYSQLLAVIGRHQDAKPYASKALESARHMEEDSMLSNIYYLTGLNLANLLEYLNEVEECGLIFERLQRFNPAGVHIGEYAYFLHRRKRDYDAAEKLYKKALELFPDQSSIHLKYAGFLRHVRRNVPAAEREYILAVEANPTNADALGNYASFLHGVNQNIKDAEVFYQRAVEADDSHANNLCNYGLFLSEEKQDFLSAEKMYKRVLEVTPNHANTLYNYAVLLDTHLQRKRDAERLYRAAVEIEARHAYALYNLAVLLEEQYASEGLFLTPEAAASLQTASATSANSSSSVPKQDTDKLQEQQRKCQEVGVFYQRAAEADPRDATTLADYARYIFVRLDRGSMAEPLFQAALKLDSACEVALYHLALLYVKEKKLLDQAELLLKQLLTISPQHANGTLTLARLLADKVQAMSKAGGTSSSREPLVEETLSCYDRAIQLTKEPAFIMSEYLKFVSIYGNQKVKMAAIKSMGQYVADNAAAAQSTGATATTNTGSIITAGEAMATCKALIEELRSSVR